MNTALASTPELASLSPSLFDDATRLYALRIAGMTDELMVVGFRAREALSDLYEYEVDLLCTDAHLELKRFIAAQAALSLTLADGMRAVRSGYIREAERLDSDGGLAAYRIRLVPWLWLATQQRHNRVFQDKTVLQIFEEVVGDYAPRAAWRAAPEVDAYLAQARARSYTVQYRESDYAFVSRLLAEEGMGFCFRDISGAEAQKPSGNIPSPQPSPPAPLPGGRGEHRAGQVPVHGTEPELGDAPLHELLIFADSTALPEDYSSVHQNGGRGIRFHRAASQEDQDGIQAFGAQRILQHATTTLASYDYKAKRVIGASILTDHAYGGPNAPALESYDWAGAYAFADSTEAERAARLLREAVEARNKIWIGQASVRTFRPGTCFDLTESPLDEGKAGQESDRRFLLTAVRSRGVNNLPRELSQRARALLGSEDDPALQAAALSHGYSAHIHAIRATVPWRPVLTDGNGARLNPRPTASGVHSAVVVGADGQSRAKGADEIHTDKLGRIKVRFAWQQGQDRSTCWLRVASRYAGAGHGAQFTPRIGQEVLVGFLEEDIDRPIVLGALYNGLGEGASPPTPGGQSGANTDPNVFALARDNAASAQGNLAAGNSPAWHGQGAGDAAHRHGGALTGFKTQEFGAQLANAGYNQLVFDDSANQLRVQLATTQAASQLNLGHLIHQADNYRGSFRGQGFELRTDAYGAIRAGRGLILSTYQGSTPDANPEPAGDFAAGQALLKQASQLAQSFSQAAATHQTVRLAAHEGSNQAGQSVIDDQGAPLKALHTAASGMVGGQALEAALQDTSAKNTATSASPLPAAGEGPGVRGDGTEQAPPFQRSDHRHRRQGGPGPDRRPEPATGQRRDADLGAAARTPIWRSAINCASTAARLSACSPGRWRQARRTPASRPSPPRGRSSCRRSPIRWRSRPAIRSMCARRTRMSILQRPSRSRSMWPAGRA